MKLFDHVKIKSSGKTGTIIDVRGESTKRYMVEDDKESEAPGLDRWPIYDCLEHDLEITDQ